MSKIIFRKWLKCVEIDNNDNLDTSDSESVTYDVRNADVEVLEKYEDY